MSAFVDASALYAIADRGDRSHARATEIVTRADEPLITSDHVLVESWLLAASRGGHHAADRLWQHLRAGAARIEPISAADLEAAWRIGEAFPDQDFSIVDRTSFAAMERLGLSRAIAFDDDFAIYRFGPKREHAFEVLR